ncbi:S9 family peptidase [Aestuariimicrobium sp. T2.26MG-19.2B]|uniref:S9 family peptidase n=1 Tax=Aestuariimicrobium sp. T2.26MG-19.2B TaxID=3040679 RepID=UPI002477B4CB|nr:S9 family peptidase [Aestuariimicrobium sp. T2.26MG-19.2B]CAI9402388.1 Dipeptidyl-peptidase 5 [Aestuariimicrobium sp. T2.26MG-19.2B]
MRPDQLDLLTTVSEPEIHPSGTWAVVSTSRPSFEVDSYVGQLWRIPLDGAGQPRRITRGRADSGARFSPDGSVLAFLRAVDGKPQLHLMEATGGEPLAVTDQKLGVREFCFSPDGSTIAFTARVPEAGRYGTDDDIPAALEDPRHFTGNKLQMNGLGWLNGRPLQVFTLTVPALDGEPALKPVGRAKPSPSGEKDDPEAVTLVPRATRVTEDQVDWSNPTFTPDGAALIVSGEAHDGRENDLVDDLYRLELQGKKSGQLTRLTNTGKPKQWIGAAAPVHSSDGKHLFFVGQPLGETGRDFIGHHAQVYVLPATTEKGVKGKPTIVTDASITVASQPRPFGDDGVIFTDDHRGSGRILTATAKGKVEVIFDGALMAQAVAAVGDTVVATVAGSRTMGEVALVRDGSVTVLTDFSAALQQQTSIVDPIEFETTGADGYPVHGWVLKPTRRGKGRTPVLLNIHGGPYAAYHETYFDEFQAYLEAGYAVVACNPRGAMGYGAEHGQAIKGDFGNLDMADILTFLDGALAANPDLDADRVGIMGGSYGGYMTAWIIGHDHRWAGAIVERGFLDGATFVGSSDIGWFFAGEYQGHSAEEMNRQSPMWLTDQVTTPTLVLHSELDLRCPIAQGLNYYGRLKQAGVDAELLVFPGENHELTRSGSPWHRRQRFEKILEFWGKHLPVKA